MGSRLSRAMGEGLRSSVCRRTPRAQPTETAYPEQYTERLPYRNNETELPNIYIRIYPGNCVFAESAFTPRSGTRLHRTQRPRYCIDGRHVRKGVSQQQRNKKRYQEKNLPRYEDPDYQRSCYLCRVAQGIEVTRSPMRSDKRSNLLFWGAIIFIVISFLCFLHLLYLRK